MKALFPTLVFFLFAAHATAQDLIVTAQGDSIHCKITKEKDGFVYFMYTREGNVENTLMPRSEIETYTRGYFSDSQIVGIRVDKARVYRPWRYALQGGYSYQIGKLAPNVPADFRDYTNELRSGFHIGGDVARYFNDVLGAGLKINVLKQSNEMDDVWIDDGSGQRYGRMSDNITSLFVAPTFTNRYLSANRRNAFIMNVSLGYLHYVNNAVLVDPFTLKGGTVGAAIDAGYDVGIGNDFLLGFQLSYVGGALSQYKINGQKVELDEDNRLGMSRVDISIGLRLLK